MASKKIKINLPQLAGGEYFKVRYRELPSGTFTSYQNETNAEFTLTGLTPNANYEVEIIYVKLGLTDCPATYQYFTVPEDYTCVNDFAASIVQGAGGLYWLEITYTPPATSPSAGWEIIYQKNGSNTTVKYATLPASGTIRIQVANVSTSVTIRAMIGGGQYLQCAQFDVSAIVDPPCVAISNLNISFREVLKPNGRCDYYIDISFTQSNPASNPIYLDYQQLNFPAYDFFQGNVPVPSGTNVSMSVKIRPYFLTSQEITEYVIAVVDTCGNGLPIKYQFIRTTCFQQEP